MTQSDPASRLSQMRLPFPDSVKRFEDLALTDANRAAIEAIRRWADWQHPVLCLVGPVQSGLGIAGKLWVREAGGLWFDADTFDGLDLGGVEAAASANSVIDLADNIENEANLLAMLNFCQDKDSRLLLTARAGSALWNCASADLKSRLDTIPVAEIYPPDEAMVGARLLASCKRRYIKLDKATVDYLTIRLPRSYIAIEDYIARLDEAISQTGRAAGIHLARSVLEDGVETHKLFSDDEG